MTSAADCGGDGITDEQSPIEDETRHPNELAAQLRQPVPED